MPRTRRGGLRVLYLCCRGYFGIRSRLRDTRGFFYAMYVLVGNFPAEVTPLAALFHMLFEEDRAPGIRRECARGGQQYIPHSILNGDFAAQKLSE